MKQLNSWGNDDLFSSKTSVSRHNYGLPLYCNQSYRLDLLNIHYTVEINSFVLFNDEERPLSSPQAQFEDWR